MFAKRITVTSEVNEKIKRAMGVTGRTVYNALTFDKKYGYSDKAKRIRMMALQNGGMLMAELPLDEVIHDSGRCMRQYFANDVMLEISKETGDAIIYYKGEALDFFHDVSVRQMEDLQEMAKGFRAQAS
ncbi:MAG: hypothetical protein IJ190_00945 [Prevotella sp.]|nr:hypothetical protein [Prevotella sp.]